MHEMVARLGEELVRVPEVARHLHDHDWHEEERRLLRVAHHAVAPREELWALEGTSEKWCQQVSGYYFAAATLQDVRFAESGGARFTFYYDAEEPLNSDDPRRNVNPEVIFCTFDSSDA